MKALIIAAGKGSRLREDEDDKPKPLYKVAGLTLLERTILSSKKAGITEFVIVVGFKGDEIVRFTEKKKAKWGVSITIVNNPDFEQANGHSVLKAKEHLTSPFVLMMSDHLFNGQILQDLIEQPLNNGEIILAVDPRVDSIFDLDDATKVKTKNHKIDQIGKTIPEYDTIDTGLFYCSPALFDSLEKACAQGKGSLSEAIQDLAQRGMARTFEIGPYFWQDVDTPETLKFAEKSLFEATRKKTDGFISKNINRRISGWISSYLVKLPITPNQITWSSLVLSLLSAYLVSLGTGVAVAIGGLLFQFTSIYDGCDGEVSRIKLIQSKFGEWLDTIGDNISYFAFFSGVMIGLYRQNFPAIIPLGALTFFGILMTLGLMYAHLIRNTNSGTLVTVQKEIEQKLQHETSNPFIWIIYKLRFMMKRDFFALFFMFLCFFNRLDWILYLALAGANITWMVFLFSRRDMKQKSVENEVMNNTPIQVPHKQ